MTPPEKRYFKLFANAFHQDSDLTRLYAMLDTDKEIEDGAITKKTGIKNLPVSRSNLRKLILKAMRSYNETSQQLQLRNIITDMEWLEGKGLTDEALKEMRRAHKFGVEHEVYGDFANLMLMQRRSLDTKDPDQFTQEYEKLIADTEKYASLAADYATSMLFNSYVVKYTNIVGSYEAANVLHRKQQLLIKAQERLSKTKTIRGRLLLLITVQGILSAMGRYEECFKTFKQIFAIYDETPYVKENPIMLYMLILNSYCNLCDFTARHAEHEKGLESFITGFEELGIPRLDKAAQLKMRGVILFQRTSFARRTGNTRFLNGIDDELMDVVNHQGMGNLPEAVNSAILHYIGYNLQTLNLVAAGEWLTRFYNFKHSKLSRSMYLAARLLEVIMFYEQKDFDIADTKAINLYKTIMEFPDEMQGEHQKVIGVFLRRLCQWQPGNKTHKTEMQKWIDDVAEHTGKRDAFLKEVFAFFDITGWLKKKFL